MTTTALDAARPARLDLLGWIATTDHKRIGVLYGVTALGFFIVAGLMALVMRAELAEPGLQLVGEQAYNGLFTIHGTAMMLLFATPMVAAFANFLIPLQVGRAGHGVPAAQRPQLLAVPVRRARGPVGVPRRVGTGRRRLDGLPAELHAPVLDDDRAPTSGSSACC